jgi:hypothetical protein
MVTLSYLISRVERSVAALGQCTEWQAGIVSLFDEEAQARARSCTALTHCCLPCGCAGARGNSQISPDVLAQHTVIKPEGARQLMICLLLLIQVYAAACSLVVCCVWAVHRGASLHASSSTGCLISCTHLPAHKQTGLQEGSMEALGPVHIMA